ncbi:MAG: Holliday junction branch migration protein RuvA [Parachlamydiaceae bacterium]|nr:Holliday junction branch migration protein RuvA [Parachlamydiaceae bacterium]
MYAYIKGLLATASPSYVIIEAFGVGYKIFIPASTFSSLPQIQNECFLHTFFVVRELSQTLYGFYTSQERDFFEALLNVTGIGPKIALALIGHMPIYELQKAISQGDIPLLCRVPGIGKKGAERLIIEMRDKVHLMHDPQEFAINLVDPRSQKMSDAMSALINLGYNQLAAQNAIKKTLKDHPDTIDLGLLITSALKHI